MKLIKIILSSIFSMFGYEINKKANVNIELFRKYKAFTMVPEKSFEDNIKLTSLIRNIEGCVVECGVWKGGMIAAIAESLGSNRKYFLFDSFEGLPQAKEVDGSNAIKWQNEKKKYYYDNCKTSEEDARATMEISGVNNFLITKGWFKDTLPLFRDKDRIALLRLDGDWYESIFDSLKYLYPLINKGGVIIVDDYYVWDGCAKAVHDYLAMNKLTDRIYSTTNNVTYIIKT